MATPLEIIRQGILSQDMNLVKNGFYLMTGEQVEEQGNTVANVQLEPAPLVEQPVKVAENFHMQIRDPYAKPDGDPDRNYTRKEPIDLSKKFNQFADDKTEALLDPAPWLNDKAKPPVAKGQRASNIVDAVCPSCGQKKTVHTMFLREGWICDRCIRRRMG